MPLKKEEKYKPDRVYDRVYENYTSFFSYIPQFNFPSSNIESIESLDLTRL